MVPQFAVWYNGRMAELPHSEVAVYAIVNRVNGKRYVGKTSRTIGERWLEHLRHSRGRTNYPFMRALRKHGPDNFEIVAYVSLGETFTARKTPTEIDEALNSLEAILISRLKTHIGRYGYNATLGGEGCVATEQTREKIRLSAVGRKATEETRAKLSASHTNPSPEHRAKLSIAARNRKKPVSAETRAKLSAAHAGKKRGAAFSAKMSALLKGKVSGMKGKRHSPETIAKMRARAAGRIISSEARSKISASLKAFNQIRRRCPTEPLLEQCAAK